MDTVVNPIAVELDKSFLSPTLDSAYGVSGRSGASSVEQRRRRRGPVHRARGREDEPPDTRLLRRTGERDGRLVVDVVGPLLVEIADGIVRERREMDDRVEAFEVLGGTSRTSRSWRRSELVSPKSHPS